MAKKKLVTLRIPKKLNKYYDALVKKINIARKQKFKKEITKSELFNILIFEFIFEESTLDGEFNYNYQQRFFSNLKEYKLNLKNDKQISFYITNKNEYMLGKMVEDNGNSFTENIRCILVYYASKNHYNIKSLI